MPKSPLVIVITGTSKGIGKGVAEYYLSKGNYVCGCSRSAAMITHERYEHKELTVTDEDGVSKWIRSIKKKHQRIDVLFNNAGSAPAAFPVLMTSGAILEDVLRTNVMGSFITAREAALVMQKNKFGRIINVSSMAVGLHEEGTAAYAASKNAIVEFTRIMAKEVAGFGITCNVIAPSMIETDAVAALGEDIKKRALSKLTLKRTVTMAEICHVLDFLIDENGSAITGQTIHMGLIS